ncbi:MAG: NfeD family protein [Clostridiales bacterium]|nr:NfeD family protein [Clostridiales bacterium]
MTIVWALLFALFVIVELTTIQLVSIWLAISALVSMFMSIFNAPFWSQLLVFAVLSAILLLATRPIVRKMIKDVEPTNSDLDIGSNATVIEGIDNIKGKGRAKLNGIDWTARSVNDIPIPEGTIVIVKEIDGSKLLVESKTT